MRLLQQQINANEERNKRSVANKDQKRSFLADQMAVGIYLEKKEDVSPIIT